jgi:hypothetical protein
VRYRYGPRRIDIKLGSADLAGPSSKRASGPEDEDEAEREGHEYDRNCGLFEKCHAAPKCTRRAGGATAVDDVHRTAGLSDGRRPEQRATFRAHPKQLKPVRINPKSGRRSHAVKHGSETDVANLRRSPATRADDMVVVR